MTTRRVVWLLPSMGVGALLIGFWQFVSDHRIVSPVFLPGPDRAWAALVTGFLDGELAPRVLGTIEHMFYGWFLASLLGVALGSLIGVSAVARAYLAPMLEFFRPLPASAIFPLAVGLLGLSDRMVLAVIGFGAVWPTLLATIHGFAAVEPRLYDVGRALGLGRLSFVWKIALPNALPDIIAGMRISLTVSLILAVVGEMLASANGLGLWILLAARAFRAPIVFAGVILLGLIGYASAQAISLLEHYLLRWRQ